MPGHSVVEARGVPYVGIVEFVVFGMPDGDEVAVYILSDDRVYSGILCQAVVGYLYGLGPIETIITFSGPDISASPAHNPELIITRSIQNRIVPHIDAHLGEVCPGLSGIFACDIIPRPGPKDPDSVVVSLDNAASL
jgi:hypothetical protein